MSSSPPMRVCDRRGSSTRLGFIVLVVGIVASLVACGREAPPLAAAGHVSNGAFAVGPQPGPARPLARPVNPYEGNMTVLLDGRRLFNWFNCSGCHGDHGGGGMGPSLRDSLWRYGGDDASIFASITEGRRDGMPAWGTKVPADQIWRIVTYIKSMRTPNEPDPPR